MKKVRLIGFLKWSKNAKHVKVKKRKPVVTGILIVKIKSK